MKRAPLTLRTAGLLLALTALLAAAPGPSAPPADVTAVSVLPAPGRADVVIDIRGVVEVSDFVLGNPARVVVDLSPARLVAPTMQYDGVTRGGIRNIRYGQYRPDIVRVVVDLDAMRDYRIAREEGALRITLEAAQPFDAWSSDAARVGRQRLAAAPSAPAAAAPAPAQPAPSVTVVPAAAPAAPRLPAAPPASASRARPVPRTTIAAANDQPQQTQQACSQQARISVTFDQANINEVIANFAAFSGRSIITGKEVAGVVTAEIRDQPWDCAFNAILQGQGLAASELPGGIIRVDSRANLAVQDSLEPLTTRIIKINYARAASLAPSVAGIVTPPPRGRAVADSTTNSIIVTDLASRISADSAFIAALDVRTPQVAIQAKIVFVERTDLEDLGLKYDLGSNTQFFNRLIQRPDLTTDPTGATLFSSDVNVINLGGNAVSAIANAFETLPDGNPALSLIYSTVIGNFTLSAFLDALQQVSLADVQAEPQVTVADNRPASIFSGERTPIRIIDVSAVSAGGAAPARATTRLEPTGITLRVTPHVVSGTREVLLELHAERSGVTPSAVGDIGAVFSSQEATTELLVRDGETAVIGGLTVTEVTVKKTGIPFLVDLPVIGRLFGFRGSKELRRDLLILVTPHIVDDLITGPGGPNRE